MPLKQIDLWDEYKKWLLWRIGFEYDNYENLMNQLHNTQFIYVIDMDSNRAGDGEFLRYDFFESVNISTGTFEQKCSVLEMLVGLALRVNDEYIGDPADPRPYDFFYQMLSNLGLDIFDDSSYDEQIVGDIVNRWMNREFEYDGYGSIFPLSNPIKDQRTHEIWSQLQEYLTENY